MSKIWKSVVKWMLIAIGILLLEFLFIWYGTSKEVWYADEHDGQCELITEQAKDCHCYERFVNNPNN